MHGRTPTVKGVRSLALLLAGTLLVLAASACSSSDDDTASTGDTTATTLAASVDVVAVTTTAPASVETTAAVETTTTELGPVEVGDLVVGTGVDSEGQVTGVATTFPALDPIFVGAPAIVHTGTEIVWNVTIGGVDALNLPYTADSEAVTFVRLNLTTPPPGAYEVTTTVDGDPGPSTQFTVE